MGRVPDDLGVDAHVASAGVERVVLANGTQANTRNASSVMLHASAVARFAFHVPRSTADEASPETREPRHRTPASSTMGRGTAPDYQVRRSGSRLTGPIYYIPRGEGYRSVSRLTLFYLAIGLARGYTCLYPPGGGFTRPFPCKHQSLTYSSGWPTSKAISRASARWSRRTSTASTSSSRPTPSSAPSTSSKASC